MGKYTIGQEIQEITDIGTGFMASRVLLTANRLGLFGALAEGGDWSTADEAAGRIEVDPRACAMVLDVLCNFGFVEKDGDRYRVKPSRAPYLVPGGTHYVGDILRHHDRLWERWSRLTEVVRTGKQVSRGEVPGHRESEGARKDFILGMANIGAQGARELVEVLAPRGPMRMLDVGGGPGTYALQFAEYNPELEAVVFDLPEVIPIAEEQIRGRGLEARVGTAGGDYLEPALPGGNDLALLSNIIHALGPEENIKVLRNIHQSLKPGGRLVVKDFYPDDDRTGPPFPVLFAINMLVGTEAGNTYTTAEVIAWLEEAGFSPGEQIPLAKHSMILIGYK